MNLRFVPAALAELEEAAKWYEDRESGLGNRFIQAVSEVSSAILRTSLLHTKLPAFRTSRDIRRKMLKVFTYPVIYEVRKDELLALAVAHERRRPTYWRERGKRDLE